MAINKRKAGPARTETSHKNWMAGESWDISSPLLRLRIAASSSFFGEPTYYHSGDEAPKPRRKDRYAYHGERARLSERDLTYLRDTLDAIDPVEWRSYSPAEMMISAIDAALNADPEATLAEAVRLRSDENIRTTPQVVLVRAANHKSVKGTGLVRKYGTDIIQRPDEPAVQLAYQLATYGKPIPNSLKRLWRHKLASSSEYGLAKYRMASRQVKTVDVVNLTHPASDPVNKLVRDKLTLTGETWEAIISEKGSTAEAWTEALEHMGHMALLRNLANLTKVGVDPKIYASRLIKGVETGRQLPFRYFSAYKAIEKTASPVLLDAVSTCLNRSYGNLPAFPGRVMSLCDNSGSAWGTTTSSMGTMRIAEIANLTAVVTGLAATEGYVGVFGDGLNRMPVRKSASVMDMVLAANQAGTNIGGGTENGIWMFWDQAIKAKEHWDHVFIYSDMQAGHGGLFGINPDSYADYLWGSSGRTSRYIDVPKLIGTYRTEVNPKVNVFLVQVAGYQDTIVPETYYRTFILGGWGDGLLRYAASMINLFDGQ